MGSSLSALPQFNKIEAINSAISTLQEAALAQNISYAFMENGQLMQRNPDGTATPADANAAACVCEGLPTLGGIPAFPAAEKQIAPSVILAPSKR